METVRLFRVFLSAPADVISEYEIVSGILREWNVQHGQALGVRVELVHWRTHTYPATGRRAQALINKQAFDQSDIVVGIFWTKFGTPTGRYGSGTEEELRRGITQNKSVMVYFSRIPPPSGQGQPLQASKITAFKEKLGKKALYWEFSSLDGFERDFRNHLAMAMQGLQKRHKPGK
jgi:hypothetical protein